jgi:hypothetical protein
MKIILSYFLILFCLGCNSQDSGQLSPQQKEQITNEVEAVADSIWAKWEELNPEGALTYYSDSPDWVSFNSVGSRYDFQTYKKLATDFKNSAATYKWTTIRRNFILVTKDIVICNWVGKEETLWKSGDKTIFDPHTYTLIFKKISGKWKLDYSHDSGIAMTQKSGKK